MVARKVGHLWIKECGIKKCEKEGRWHYHRLNPRGQAMTATRMTVLRAIKAIDAFDQLDKNEDWSDVPSNKWLDILGDKRYTAESTVLELWKRYQDRSLHQQVLDLTENLVMDDLSDENRKEIRSAINRIRKELDRRSKRRSSRTNARRRSR